MIEEELENSIFHLTKQNESLLKENQKLKNEKEFLKVKIRIFSPSFSILKKKIKIIFYVNRMTLKNTLFS